MHLARFTGQVGVPNWRYNVIISNSARERSRWSPKGWTPALCADIKAIPGDKGIYWLWWLQTGEHQ